MALNLTKSLIEGSAFLGKFKTQKPLGKIAVVDLELSRANLQSWLGTIGVSTEDVVELPLRGRASGFATALLDSQARSELAAKFRDQNVDVLIIDPLSVLLNSASIDENSNSEVGAMLRNGITALREEAGRSDVLVVHHAGHGANKRAREASVNMDWPDALWTLTVDSNASDSDDDEADLVQGNIERASRYFKAVGRDVEVPETVLNFNSETKELTVTAVGMSRKKSSFMRKISRQEVLIMTALFNSENHQIVSKSLLKEKVGLHSQSCKIPLDNLVSNGMVKIVGGKVIRGKASTFALTEMGVIQMNAGEKDEGIITPTDPIIKLVTPENGFQL